MTGRVVFFRRGAPPILVPLDLPERLPCRIEFANELAQVDPAGIDRVTAFAVRSVQLQRAPGEDDGKLLARAKLAAPRASFAVRDNACTGVWEEPITVRQWERLYAPRRWLLSLAPWQAIPGHVTAR